MMKTYTLLPIHIAKIQIDSGIMTYRMNYGIKEWVPIISWYIKGDNKNILIDTGVSAAAAACYSDAPFEDFVDFEQGLNKVGIAADDVDLIIQTHLHFDHVGNTHRCKKATVVVQKSELEFALAPHPIQGYLYDPGLLKNLCFELIDGDKEILPGIHVIHLPSHTPGIQAVSINTTKGKAVISGICCTGANFNPPEPGKESQKRHYWKVAPPGNFINLYDAYYSMIRLKGIGEILIPQHEPSLFKVGEIPKDIVGGQVNGRVILGC